jgi:hypothetical protein
MVLSLFLYINQNSTNTAIQFILLRKLQKSRLDLVHYVNFSVR